MSALAWLTLVILQLPIVSVIQLLSTTTRERPFQRDHAITSLPFFAAAVLYEVVAGIVYTILGALTLGCGYACLWVIFFLPHALGLYYALRLTMARRLNCPCFQTSAATGLAVRRGIWDQESGIRSVVGCRTSGSCSLVPNPRSIHPRNEFLHPLPVSNVSRIRFHQPCFLAARLQVEEDE